jgi:hypothetical protein
MGHVVHGASARHAVGRQSAQCLDVPRSRRGDNQVFIPTSMINWGG